MVPLAEALFGKERKRSHEDSIGADFIVRSIIASGSGGLVLCVGECQLRLDSMRVPLDHR
jgi:hypothetical protein